MLIGFPFKSGQIGQYFSNPCTPAFVLNLSSFLFLIYEHTTSTPDLEIAHLLLWHYLAFLSIGQFLKNASRNVINDSKSYHGINNSTSS